MISSFRNFAKTKFAGLLVFIMIIPFVFWGMGSMFNGGNTNTLAKINNTNISTQEFVDYVNKSNIPQKTIKDNLDKNIIEELLSNLVSTTLLDLEIKDFNITVSKKTLLKKIKENKNFLDDNGVFQRNKYEKFLLENSLSAPIFEQRLKTRELQKNLFDYIGAGTISPDFLINKLFKEENRKIDIKFIDLKNFYKNKDEFNDQEIIKFISENKEKLKIEYLDFDYAIVNPKNLVGVDEFNQTFFDKIDQIEIDISNDVDFQAIIQDLGIQSKSISNFRFSSNKDEIEKKIFELRENEFDIFENNNDYIIYKIKLIEERSPDINDKQIKKEIVELISQKNKFDYNNDLLMKINNKTFNQDQFNKMGQDITQSITLNSIKDNNRFNINAVELLYSLPINSFTLINDDESKIYLAKIIKFEDKKIENDNENYTQYIGKQNTNNKTNILQSYDIFLNDKYDVVLNQKTIKRVKNFFQ